MSVDPNQKKMLEVAKKIKTSRLLLRDALGFGLPVRDRLQNLKLEIPQRQTSNESKEPTSQQSPQEKVQKRLAETREKLQNRPKLLGLGGLGFFKQQPTQEELIAKREKEQEALRAEKERLEKEAKAKEKRDREESLARAKESMSIGDL